MTSEIESAVCSCVDLLLPRGSCSPNRWLTFDFEAKNGNDYFDWQVQYSAPSNYVSYRVLWGSVPHVKVSEHRENPHLFSTWIPQAELREGQRVMMAYGQPLIAPGFVITEGSHDSCWRDHACALHGYPFVPRNMYGRDGKQHISWQATTWFRLFHDTEIKVNRISVEGPVNTMYGAQEKWSTFTDGTWNNDTGLTGPWGIFHGLSKLVHTVGQDHLHLQLRSYFQRGKYGTRNFREISETIHYRLKDGLVEEKGINDENPFSVKVMEKVETPYLLDAASLYKDCGVKQTGRGAYALTNLFSSFRNRSK